MKEKVKQFVDANKKKVLTAVAVTVGACLFLGGFKAGVIIGARFGLSVARKTTCRIVKVV